jgi:hypothetical protein
MNTFGTFRNILLACGLGGAAAAGCVITTGSVDCEVCNDSPLCHNHVGTDANTGQDACFCDAGYTWSNPNDPNDLKCVRVPNKPGSSSCTEPNSYQSGNQCFCDAGYTWCSDNPDDLTCCLDPAQDAVGGSDTEGDTVDSQGTDTDPSGTDTDDTSSSTTGQNEPPPPEDCTEDGLRACSNTNPDNVQGSTAWTCLTGEWVELDLDDECQFENTDFSYGCYDDGTGVIIECGNGPGTACTDADDACSDSDLLLICIWGKLTEVSCLEICQDPASEITFEFGECIAGEARCQCCDDPVDNTCDCDGESNCE